MKRSTRAIVGACCAIGALVGVVNVASADPTITNVVTEDPGDVTSVINLDLIERIEALHLGQPVDDLPTYIKDTCPGDVYVYVRVSTQDAELCV